MYDRELQVALAAAEKAQQIVAEAYGRFLQIADAPADIHTEADAHSQETILRHIRQEFPGDALCAEEETPTLKGVPHMGPRLWIVDPIDGTRGFLEGKTVWCVSVAVVEGGRTLAGVLECPARDETFWALPRQGAFRNGERIRVRQAGEHPEVAGPKALIDALPQPWQGRLERRSYIPSLAYRLAMIADGSLDATFVKPNAHDWDLAAADLILREAGGGVVNEAGEAPLYAAGALISHGALAAGSGELLRVMGSVIAESAVSSDSQP